MKKEIIESTFQELLVADGCTSFSEKSFYLCRPLYKTTKDATEEYGFSLYIYGVLALRTQYKGKWASYIDISNSCHSALGLDGIPLSDNSFYHVKIETPSALAEIAKKIYTYCRNNVNTEFDCCSRYEQCSDAKTCIHPDKQRALLCGYRKKLEKGIIFYGKNRNI